MKWLAWARKFSVVLLLGVFFYSSSVKELHYAFSAQHQIAGHTDHCDQQHIHSSTGEEDCFICKMDVIGAFRISECRYSFAVIFLPKEIISKPDQVFLSPDRQTLYLRGPPALI